MYVCHSLLLGKLKWGINKSARHLSVSGSMVTLILWPRLLVLEASWNCMQGLIRRPARWVGLIRPWGARSWPHQPTWLMYRWLELKQEHSQYDL